jgi:hypothetical protein
MRGLFGAAGASSMSVTTIPNSPSDRGGCDFVEPGKG